LVIAVTILAMVGWQQGWFGEPTHNGQTVTEWLDQLKLTAVQKTPTGTIEFPRSPEALRNDPAMIALLEIGRDAVPVLVKTITTGADWPPEIGRWERMKRRLHWNWLQFRDIDSGWSGSVAPRSYSNWQLDRKRAASFVLVALGTNNQAGLPRFLDAYAAAPKHKSIYGNPVAGPPVGAYPRDTVERVKDVFPKLKEELVGEIRKGLERTDASGLSAAIATAGAFPEEVDLWRSYLVRYALHHPDPSVRTEALHKFTIAPNDAELIRTAEVAFGNTDNPPQTRTWAAIALQRAGTNAIRSLPVLRAALDDESPKVREAASNAIQRIEN
jgi:hypothetical protein